jgi:hypothetical protein
VSRNVFFRDGATLRPVESFIAAQNGALRPLLRAAADEFATTGVITMDRAWQLADGDWSLWLDGAAGERVNFILCTSRLEEPATPERPRAPRRLVHLAPAPGRPGDDVVVVDGRDYIARAYSGRVRDELLRALDQALAGGGGETVEQRDDGVVLRVPAIDRMVRQWDVELPLLWAGAPHVAKAPRR